METIAQNHHSQKYNEAFTHFKNEITQLVPTYGFSHWQAKSHIDKPKYLLFFLFRDILLLFFFLLFLQIILFSCFFFEVSITNDIFPFSFFVLLMINNCHQSFFVRASGCDSQLSFRRQKRNPRGIRLMQVVNQRDSEKRAIKRKTWINH